eukprot:1182454-Prorocentrum_minimum.AAC.1
MQGCHWRYSNVTPPLRVSCQAEVGAGLPLAPLPRHARAATGVTLMSHHRHTTSTAMPKLTVTPFIDVNDEKGL